MRCLLGSFSVSLAFFQSESRCWLCACVSLFRFNSWLFRPLCIGSAGVCMSMTQSWLWNFRGGQSLLFNKRAREIKNEVSIRHIFSRTFHFCQIFRSILVSSLVRQVTLFLSLIDFFDHMLMCSF